MEMKMEKLIHLKLGIKHPISAIRYIMRKKLWLKVLNTTQNEINKLYTELHQGNLLRYINQKLNLNTAKIRQAELYVICRLLKPKIVIETGVENGISSTFILWALQQNGKGTLYSIEILERLLNGKQPGWLIPTNLRKRWRLFIGNSLEVIPKITKEISSVDIFIHDSEHSYKVMMKEYSLIWPYIKSGGLLLSDDTGRNEAFIHFCKKVKRKPLWTERGYGILQK